MALLTLEGRGLNHPRVSGVQAPRAPLSSALWYRMKRIRFPSAQVATILLGNSYCWDMAQEQPIQGTGGGVWPLPGGLGNLISTLTL